MPVRKFEPWELEIAQPTSVPREVDRAVSIEMLLHYASTYQGGASVSYGAGTVTTYRGQVVDDD